MREPPESVVANLLVGAPLRVLEVRNGRIGLGASPIKALYAQFDAGEETGALSGSGSFAYKSETVRYTVETGLPKAVANGEALPVTVKFDSALAKTQIAGTASFANEFKLEGDMQAEIGDLRAFLAWVGFTVPQGKSLNGLSLSGPFRLSGGTLSFDDGTFTLDGNKAVGALALAASPFPRIEGTFAFDRLILDPYLGKDDASGGLFDQALLRYFDADLRISGSEIVAGPLNLGKGGFTITAKGGANALAVACGIGASVRVFARSERRFGPLRQRYPQAQFSTAAPEVADADLVIAGVLIPGQLSPKLITRAMLRAMRPGSALVDVGIDQGGIAETSRPTSHSEPVYLEEGVVHYCVPNMPAAVARTASLALERAVLPFVLEILSGKPSESLATGIQVKAGKVTHEYLARDTGREFHPL